MWCSNPEQVETCLVCNAFIRINRRTNNWHSQNQWHVMGMKMGNCINQKGVVFGDDDLRRNGKLSVCPLRTRDLSLTVCAARRSTNALLTEEWFAEIKNFICKLSRHQFKDGCPTSSTKEQDYSASFVYFGELLLKNQTLNISVRISHKNQNTGPES